MATLRELVENVSRSTGIPDATVFAYGRFAREAGKIKQRGRGRAAAEMTATDAANLLIAIGGTGVTRGAGLAIRKYRPMRGEIYEFVPPLKQQFLEWLNPLGFEIADRSEDGTHYRLKADFGQFMEFVILEAANQGLQGLLRTIPTAEIPDELWAEWKQHPAETIDALVDKGVVKVRPADRVRFGEDVELAITFVRTQPRVDVEFKREWEGAETVFQITFYPARRGPLVVEGLRVAATLTQKAIFGAARIFVQRQRKQPPERKEKGRA